MHSSIKSGLTRMSAESTTCDFGTEFADEYRRDLKSRVPKGTYRFDSGPGHQVEFLGDPSATLGISARGSDAAQTPQLDMGVEVRLG